MRRRDFIGGIAGAFVVATWHVDAQTTTTTYHLASLTAGSPSLTNSPNIAMLLPALAEHGYKLGENLRYTPYGADVAARPRQAIDVAGADRILRLCEHDRYGAARLEQRPYACAARARMTSGASATNSAA